MKYLMDKKMMEFSSIHEVESFINKNYMFFGNVDSFESMQENFNYNETLRSLSEGNVSIFNNVYLFNSLTIDDFENILNNKEPNPIHEILVDFRFDLHQISFFYNSTMVLRINVRNENCKNLIIERISEFDAVSNENRLNDYRLLETEINNLEDWITELFNNFVREIPREYFWDFNAHRIIEYLILDKAYLNELLFNVPLEAYKFGMNYLINDQPEGVIKYLVGIIDKFKKILTHKMDIATHLMPAFIWMILRKQVVKYFANEWEERFGAYFKAVDKDYMDYIKVYCEIQEINTLDEENIGLLTYYLINKELLPEVELNKLNIYHKYYIFVEKEVQLMNEIIEYEKFEKKLMQKPSVEKMDFNDVDLFTGYEFEAFVEKLFTKMGYLSERTKGSGDQGIDVLAEKDGRKFGIQTKCYGSKVNNSAVQETVAGIAYYNCDRGIVITNNYFTKSAVDLAAKNDIILWDRNMLREKFNEYM
nr:restriction endonuclease [Sporosarcina sp.]